MNETTQPAVAGPVEPTVRHQPLPDELLWELAKAAANTDEGSGKLHYDCDKAWAREFARLVVVEFAAELRGRIRAMRTGHGTHDVALEMACNVVDA